MNLKWRLSHAQGYLELGMLREAARELKLVPAGAGEDYEVIALRAAILQEQGAWKPLSTLARKLVTLRPSEAGGWVVWAYAVRRAESLAAAAAILQRATRHHPDEPTIQFNLGCYASQRGDFPTARQHVDRAVALDEKFGLLAATDPDLLPLREHESARDPRASP